ncbi:MAG: hypothetical protein HC781_17320 [Leptolyngbyaceae cyanobacterium CSU_1_4]|nr:hypothetical protein [Leptolyngbyaceae cyanobacterium CSU_1_4]
MGISIAKEGDRSWLPLESSTVEILEGRYRIVARSSRPNTLLEIKVTQQDLDEMPPVRRIQKRSAKTNPQGLVVIMPFTRLQPGDWELRCTGDLMDDMLGKGWVQRCSCRCCLSNSILAGRRTNFLR